jgi:hypothetical protein
LKCLEKADWTCSWCGDNKQNLQVHHGYYRKGATPWSYPQKTLHVLCETCHGRAEWEREELYRLIASIHPKEISRLAMMLAESGGLRLSKLEFITSNDGDKDNEQFSLAENSQPLTEEEMKNFFGDLKGLL